MVKAKTSKKVAVEVATSEATSLLPSLVSFTSRFDPSSTHTKKPEYDISQSADGVTVSAQLDGGVSLVGQSTFADQRAAKAPGSLQRYIAILMPDQTLKVVPVQHNFQVSHKYPVRTHLGTVSEVNTDYRTRNNEVVSLFGSRRQQLAIKQRAANRIDSSHIVGLSMGDTAMSEAGQALAARDDMLTTGEAATSMALPPHNKDTLDPAAIYPLEGLVPKGFNGTMLNLTILDVLDGQVRDMTQALLRMSTSIESLSPDEQVALVRSLLLATRLSSQFDTPYEASQYVPVFDLQLEIREFLAQSTRPEGIQHPLFVLLADMGMGKSWNMWHVALQAMESDAYLPVVVCLRNGFFSVMERYAGSSQVDKVADWCRGLRQSGRTPMLLLDGLDEIVRGKHASEVLAWLSQFLTVAQNQCVVMLSCRPYEWQAYSEVASAQQELKRHIFGKGGTTCDPFLLSDFSDAECRAALSRYSITKDMYLPQLAGLYRKPYFLRLLSDYAAQQIQEQGRVSMATIDDFLPLFYDRQDKRTGTVLFRMGVTREVLDAFYTVGEVLHKTPYVNRNVFDRELLEGRAWRVLVSTGLISEVRDGKHVVLSVSEAYGPLLERVIVDSNRASPPTSTHPTPSANTQPRQVDFFTSQPGDDALTLSVSMTGSASTPNTLPVAPMPPSAEAPSPTLSSGSGVGIWAHSQTAPVVAPAVPSSVAPSAPPSVAAEVDPRVAKAHAQQQSVFAAAQQYPWGPSVWDCFQRQQAGQPVHLSICRPLDERAVTVLSRVLCYLPYLTELSLSGCRLGSNGVLALAFSLGRVTALTKLDLSGNAIGDTGGDTLCELFGSLTHLNEVNLTSNKIGFFCKKRLKKACPASTIQL
ncbi:RNA polymerase I associated factor, A49-like [Kipferlia bialata]|uniref:RNA polymerase I associated factor, A49-like n=1 Tax=Kipferlia bialata TaxID=797122 RepID=A0A9K3GKF1_9EUKA|nr:RNA polymerase I associated factor, A49-like [Kipferlia bialata]|eukprot:g9169.t1